MPPCPSPGLTCSHVSRTAGGAGTRWPGGGAGLRAASREVRAPAIDDSVLSGSADTCPAPWQRCSLLRVTETFLDSCLPEGTADGASLRTASHSPRRRKVGQPRGLGNGLAPQALLLSQTDPAASSSHLCGYLNISLELPSEQGPRFGRSPAQGQGTGGS